MVRYFFTLLMVLALSGCFSGGSSNHQYKRKHFSQRHSAKYIGHYKVGSKYKSKGKTYRPKKVTKYRRTGYASWYGSKDGFHGKKTANGDIFNKYMLTAAHPTLPMPSIVRVTNLENRRSIILMVNDRGPFRKNRILDASETAASLLGYRNKGFAKVRVEYLHDETKALLWKLSLKPKHGSRPHGKMKDHRCSVDCYLNKLNKKIRRRA